MWRVRDASVRETARTTGVATAIRSLRQEQWADESNPPAMVFTILGCWIALSVTTAFGVGHLLRPRPPV